MSWRGWGGSMSMGKILMSRWFHKLYAKAFGYTWMQCPICGDYFGGHEILDKKIGWVTDLKNETWPVCPKDECNSEAIRLNISKWYEEHHGRSQE